MPDKHSKDNYSDNSDDIFDIDDSFLDDIIAEFGSERNNKEASDVNISDIPKVSDDEPVIPSGFKDKFDKVFPEKELSKKTEGIKPEVESSEEDQKSDISGEAAQKKEFNLDREKINEKVKNYIHPDENKGITTKEALTKNKLDAFFETFYGEQPKGNNEEKDDIPKEMKKERFFDKNDKPEYQNDEPEATEISDNNEYEEVTEPESLNRDNEEYTDDEPAIEATEAEDYQPNAATELPERFYSKDDYDFPIKAPKSTDTKVREPDITGNSEEEFETTGEVYSKKSFFGRFMSKLLTESEDDEEPVDTGTPHVIEIDEFDSLEDKDSVIADLGLQKKEAFFKTAIGFILSILLIYLNIGSVTEQILPSFLRPSQSIFAFGTASVLLLLIMAVTGFGTFLSGAKGILTFKGTNDSLPAFALICSMIFGIYCSVAGIPAGSSFCFFGGAAAISFFLNLLGKYLHITAVGKNIGFLVTEKEKSTLVRMTKSELPVEIDTESNDIAGVVKGDFFTGFFEKSFGEDPSAKYSKKTSAIFILLSIGFAAFAFFKGGLFFSLTALCGMSALGASFLSGICFSVPNIRWLNSLKKNGAMIAGYVAATTYSDVNALVIKDSELFLPKSTEVTGMKMFGGSEIYDVAISIASLYKTLGGPLEYAFLKLVDYKKSLLQEVTDIRLFEGKGVGGIINGNEILAGNSQLLREMDIRLPMDDYEERLNKKGKTVIFFAENRVLKGLFTVNYSPAPDILKDLAHIDYENNALIVYTDDQNITSDLLRRKFGLSNMEILVYGNTTGEKIKPALEKKPRLPAGIISLNGLSGIVSAIAVAKRIKKSVRLCLVMRAVSTILAFGLGGFLIYSGTVMEPLQVFGYQSIWGVLAVIVTILGL